MTEVILQRLEAGDEGTFGRIEFKGKTLVTGELPWRDNRPNISCIPPGIYRMVWEQSPRLTQLRGVEVFTYRAQFVAGHAGILIHSGNFCGDVALGFKSHVEGCILLGKTRGTLDGQRAVLGSKAAVGEFEAEMARAPFDLEIRNAV